MSEQLPLFPTESVPEEAPRTPEEIAAHIGAHARTDFDPNARAVERTRRHGAGGGIASHLEGSEASDQTSATPQTPTTRHPRKLYEMPGQSRGRTNNPLPTRAEILEGMTPQEIRDQDRINKAGAEIARQALGK